MSEELEDKFNEKEKRKFIRNLWFLLLYASDFFAYIEKNHHSRVAENPDRLADLIGKILAETVELRLKQNLTFLYQPRQEILRRVRGRIDLFKTERRQLLQKAQIACKFEELTIDTPRNRFARDALRKISIFVSDTKLSNRCRSLSLKLERAGVIGSAPTSKQMENERYGRNDKNDKQMVYASLLAFSLALPDENAGFNDLFSPQYKKKLHDLYETAITNFYKKVLDSKKWEVHGQRYIYWRDSGDDTKEFLPAMQPDIILNNKSDKKSIVIDAKFQDIRKYGRNEHKFSRDNIFQIYAYLGSQKEVENSLVKYEAEGLLLHPNLGEHTDKQFKLREFNVRFATVNFLADEKDIRQRLLEIIES